MVPAKKAKQIDDIFEGLVGIGCQLAWAADGLRGGIALTRILKRDSVEAQQFCLETGE